MNFPPIPLNSYELMADESLELQALPHWIRGRSVACCQGLTLTYTHKRTHTCTHTHLHVCAMLSLWKTHVYEDRCAQHKQSTVPGSPSIEDRGTKSKAINVSHTRTHLKAIALNVGHEGEKEEDDRGRQGDKHLIHSVQLSFMMTT